MLKNKVDFVEKIDKMKKLESVSNNLIYSLMENFVLKRNHLLPILLGIVQQIDKTQQRANQLMGLVYALLFAATAAVVEFCNAFTEVLFCFGIVSGIMVLIFYCHRSLLRKKQMLLNDLRKIQAEIIPFLSLFSKAFWNKFQSENVYDCLIDVLEKAIYDAGLHASVILVKGAPPLNMFDDFDEPNRREYFLRKIEFIENLIIVEFESDLGIDRYKIDPKNQFFLTEV